MVIVVESRNRHHGHEVETPSSWSKGTAGVNLSITWTKGRNHGHHGKSRNHHHGQEVENSIIMGKKVGRASDRCNHQLWHAGQFGQRYVTQEITDHQLWHEGHFGHKGMVTWVGSFLCLIYGGGGMVMGNKYCNGKFNLGTMAGGAGSIWQWRV